MKKASVLVVEDEYVIAIGLEVSLNSMGYDVSGVASSGNEAIYLAESCRPDIILMDIKLKGDIDGIQASEAIMSRWDIPIIYLTSHTDDRLLERAKITRPYGYILKPYSDKEIKANIKMALYRHEFEKKVNQALQKWERVFNSAADLIAIIDKDHSLLSVNKSFADCVGQQASELIGKKCCEILCNLDYPTDNCPHTKTMANGHIHTAEITGMKSEGVFMSIASPFCDEDGESSSTVYILRDITEIKKIEEVREGIISELKETLAHIKKLSGILPICASCKKIRDEKGNWHQIEVFIRDRSEAEFTHSICPDCKEKLSPPRYKKKNSVYFPKGKNGITAPDAGTAPMMEPKGQGRVVLVVDDDQKVRRALAILLAIRGFQVLEAEDGNDALSVLEATPKVDLLLTDIVMPGSMSGLDLARQILTLRPGLKVLLMSGYQEEDIFDSSTFGEGVAFIGKPFSDDDLAHKLRNLLEIKRDD